MDVTLKPLFRSGLEEILFYIAKDSKNRAKKFNNALFEGINNLENFPYKFRKSKYYNDDNIRDYIFMGYTISYLVDEKLGVIVVLDIFKWVEK